MVFVFDHTALLPGDIVFESSDSVAGGVVRFFDNGDFSHVLMWLGAPGFIEAVLGGVRVLNFDRVLVTDRAKWKVRRYPNQIVAAQAAEYARNLAFKHYSLWGAVTTIIPPFSSESPTKLFCSQLIACAYKRAGVGLVTGVRPELVKPSSLEKSEILVDVPLPLREIILEDQEATDRDATFRNSPMSEELEISQAAFRAVEGLVAGLNTPKGLNLSRPGNLAELLDFLPQLDKEDVAEVCDRLEKELKRRKYDGLLIEAAAKITISFRIGAEKLRAGRMDAEEEESFKSHYRSHMEAWHITQQHHARNFAACQNAYQIQGHSLWNYLRAMFAINKDAFDFLVNEVEPIVS